MSFDQQIKDQYSRRGHKNTLYNSVYSILADIEKLAALKSLLKEFLKIDQSTTIFEIGAGQGGNIPVFHELGFSNSSIFINELLPERIELARLHHPDVKIYEGNILDIELTAQFDVVFQSTVFTSVLSDNDRKAIADKMWSLVKPGGIILWYDFVYNNPSNPDVKKVDQAEACWLFSKAIKRKIVKVTLAPPIGRRVGKLYNLFNFPFLRSHILGVFQKQ